MIADLPQSPRLLVVRTDRLGDVVLSIPAIEVLKRFYPKSHLGVMVQPRVAPVLLGLPFIDEVIEVDPEAPLKLHGKWDLALVLQPRFKTLWALRRMGVKHRLGPLSKWYSFLLLTAGLRQRRSKVEMHEVDYNLQLLRLLGIEVGTRTVLPKVAVSAEAEAEVGQWWEQQGGDLGLGKWVAIHPGMGGSALNWPEENYLKLADSLLTEGVGVIVTGGPTEQGILDRFEGALKSRHGARVRFFGGARASDVQRLAAIYQKSRVVVAPSTGPLHVAAAVGARVVSLYPPIRVQSALRWGPYVAEWPGREDESKASVLVPQVHCGQDFKCRGQACPYYPCMSTLGVTQAQGLVQNHLKRST